MNTEQNQIPQNTEELKEIPKWTRKYAQNRMLTTLVLIVMIGFIAMVIAVLTSLVIIGFERGIMILAGVGIALLVAVLIFLLIFIRKFGGKNRGLIDQLIDQWIYGKDGTVSMPLPKTTKKMKWLDGVRAAVVSICFIGTMYAGMEGYIASKYIQPISALYLVPSLVFEYFRQRPGLGPLMLICPMLYTIHAILILAGVPIFFMGDFCMLSIFFPLVGYTFLAYVIGHVYSRYALKKLKGLAHLEGDTANGD